MRYFILLGCLLSSISYADEKEEKTPEDMRVVYQTKEVKVAKTHKEIIDGKECIVTELGDSTFITCEES